MKKKSFQNQHYVPQFYLRRFTVDGRRLFVYDKVKDEIRGPENIKNVAQERFFYDLPINSIPEDLDPQLEEKTLSKLEEQFNLAIEAALRVAAGKGADLNERLLMSWFVTTQLIRTRAFRNRLVEISSEIQTTISNALLQIIQPDWANKLKAKVTYDRGSASTLHAQFMWHKELLEQLVSGIFHHLWIIGINSTSIPLYTSDNPVVMRSHVHPSINNFHDWQDSTNITLATIETELTSPSPLEKGIEIIFPLTPTCALIMLDKVHFSYLESHQGKAFLLTENQILDFNRLQVEQSERQIFSHKNDFELPRTISQAKSKSAKEKSCNTDVKIYYQFKENRNGYVLEKYNLESIRGGDRYAGQRD